MNDINYLFKISVVGDGRVGKTSLIKKFTQSSFEKEYIKTIGAQLSAYVEEIDGDKIRVFTFSPLTILVYSSELYKDFLNVAYAATTGFFNDKVMIGVGYDFGEVKDISRWFMMVSVGGSVRD